MEDWIIGVLLGLFLIIPCWQAFKFPEPLQGTRYIRIETTSSPSWVSWREVEVIAGE